MMSREAREPVLRVDNVRKNIGTKSLWNGASLEVHSGEVVALTGPSGSGKTTLLNCVGLLDTFDSGIVTVDGVDVRKASRRKRRLLLRDSIAFLFQFHGLVDDWSVDRNLRLAQAHQPLAREQKRRARAEALDSVGISALSGQRAYTLSGGEAQRAALARLWLRPSSLLLVDEPTSALDEDNVKVVLESLRAWADRGAAVVVSTHDPRVIAFSDRTVLLDQPEHLRVPHGGVNHDVA
jgi:putative ABC transport system ATP-binding protein